MKLWNHFKGWMKNWSCYFIILVIFDGGQLNVIFYFFAKHIYFTLFFISQCHIWWQWRCQWAHLPLLQQAQQLLQNLVTSVLLAGHVWIIQGVTTVRHKRQTMFVSCVRAIMSSILSWLSAKWIWGCGCLKGESVMKTEKWHFDLKLSLGDTGTSPRLRKFNF